MGFLHARPKEWSESGPSSRFAAHQLRTGKPPPLPHVDGGQYLLRAWADLGRVEINPGFGAGPLRFAEIAAGLPWTNEAERRVIRQMSEAYLAGNRIGENVLGIPPWEP